MFQPSGHTSLLNRRVGVRGFTLTELLVVFGIIAILATMLMAGFMRMQQNARLTGMTDRVLSHLQLARSMAINHGAVYRVEIKSFVTAESQYGMWITADGSSAQLELTALPKNITVLGNLPGPTYVQEFNAGFNPDGTLSAIATTTNLYSIDIVDQSSSQGRTLQVFQGGMVRLKRGN
jgi:prepilin-type N-terminal cleavage/methylation domain-containing protein